VWPSDCKAAVAEWRRSGGLWSLLLGEGVKPQITSTERETSMSLGWNISWNASYPGARELAMRTETNSNSKEKQLDLFCSDTSTISAIQ